LPLVSPRREADDLRTVSAAYADTSALKNTVSGDNLGPAQASIRRFAVGRSRRHKDVRMKTRTDRRRPGASALGATAAVFAVFSACAGARADAAADARAGEALAAKACALCHALPAQTGTTRSPRSPAAPSSRLPTATRRRRGRFGNSYTPPIIALAIPAICQARLSTKMRFG
jgi:mono/diheme cytochrome c family protein